MCMPTTYLSPEECKMGCGLRVMSDPYYRDDEPDPLPDEVLNEIEQALEKRTMKTRTFTFSQQDYRCLRLLYANPNYTERDRLYQLSWYFDYRAQGKTSYEARDAVLETLEERRRDASNQGGRYGR